jgi:hypothetical protein
VPILMERIDVNVDRLSQGGRAVRILTRPGAAA